MPPHLSIICDSQLKLLFYMKLFSLVLTAVFAATVSADNFQVSLPELIKFVSCVSTFYKSVSYCNTTSGRDYGCYCQNDLARSAMAGCFSRFDENPKGDFKWFANYCDDYNTTLTLDDIETSYEYYEKYAQTYTALTNLSSTSTKSSKRMLAKRHGGSTTALPYVSYPIIVNETVLNKYHVAYSDWYNNFNYAYWFTDALYGYWLLVFLLAGLCNWAVVAFPNLRTLFNGRVSKAWRKYITLPALIRRKRTHHQSFLYVFSFLVPSRLETLIGSVFFWLVFLFCALKMDWSPGNPIFPLRQTAMLRMVADRTGIMGTMLLPLLILIGGRNNFLQWLTRWKFSTFIMYHRWIGRIIVALVFVHAMCYTYMEMSEYKEFMKENYIIWGTLAVTSGGLICFQGMLFLRRRFYEVFLVLHILLAALFVAGAWRHMDTFRYMEWMYAAVSVWSLDRFVRLVRMFSFGAPKAQITLLADDCLRVVVPKPSYWPSVPGGHAWVYFCHSWYFWQSHPFTFLDSTVEKNNIVFVLKTKKGATHYITKVLSKRPDRTMTMRVIVEGPYGEPCRVEHHDNAVFVAGGNGIPGIFSEVYDMAVRSTDNNKQRLKLIWILRELLTIEWVWEELHALRSTKIQATIYVTRPEIGCADVLLERMLTREESSAEEKDLYLKEGKDVVTLLREHFPHIEIKTGRPRMEEIVDAEVEEAQNSAAFVTCGHPMMVDDLRYAVVQKIDKTEKRVDFFEQLQVWA